MPDIEVVCRQHGLRCSPPTGGGFLATVPDLPGCASDGATRAEAAANAEDAIAAWLEEARALGRDIPAPTPTPRRSVAAA